MIFYSENGWITPNLRWQLAGRNSNGWKEPTVQFTGAWVSSNLPFAGSHLPVCHPASNMEFAAPFGTAKKGKAAQVEEVQPMMADLTWVARGKIRGGKGEGGGGAAGGGW